MNQPGPRRFIYKTCIEVPGKEKLLLCFQMSRLYFLTLLWPFAIVCKSLHENTETNLEEREPTEINK